MSQWMGDTRSLHSLYFPTLGQDIYLHPLHALWWLWEDHHRRWSHWIFPEILPWCHTTNRSVSDSLTLLLPPLHLSTISAASPFFSSSAFISSCNLPSHPQFIFCHPVNFSHIQCRGLWSVKSQTCRYMTWCSVVLIWAGPYVDCDGEVGRRKV